MKSMENGVNGMNGHCVPHHVVVVPEKGHAAVTLHNQHLVVVCVVGWTLKLITAIIMLVQ